MKKKYLISAAAVITSITIVSALAQSNFVKLPGLGYLTSAAPATAKITAPALAANMQSFNNQSTGGSLSDTLSAAQVSQHQDGDAIVLMTAKGDLPGILTLKLHRANDGVTVTGGEWAFNVSYTEVTAIQNPPPGEEDHQEILVQHGTLKGTISSGLTTNNSDGTLSAINSIQLDINGGSLEFAATASGTCSGQAANLQDNGNSTGAFNLNF